MTNDTKQTHTPGPWTYAYGDIYAGSEENITGLAERDNRIGLADRNNPLTTPTERDANARLMAAAPDLLEAAKLALQLCEEAGMDRTVSRSLDIVRGAIARATGGAS